MTAIDRTSTQIHLAARPIGWPSHEHFRTVRVDLADLQPGEVRVRNAFLSVDPYTRGRMNDARSYAQPYAVGEVMTGAAIGHVVASRADGIAEGDAVTHQLGWRDVSQAPAAAFRVVQPLPGAPLSAFLGVLGKAKGASRTIGSAGGPEKVALLTDRYGYDVGLDYRAAPIRQQLVAATGTRHGEGIDVYFDNVGGHLEAAIEVFNDGGRAALCGAIGGYNAIEAVPGPDNLMNMISRGLTLRGFTVGKMIVRL